MSEVMNAEILLTLKDEFSKEFEKIKKDIEGLKKEQDKVSSSVSKISDSYKQLKRDLAALGITKLAWDFAKSTVTLAGNLEQAQIAFTTMLGSAEDAKNMLADLSDFAKKTPFDLVGIRQNAKQLLAMGIESQDVIATLKSLGDVSAGLSVPLERLALNYGQVISQGKLTGRELRDFTIAGVPILDELATMLGKSKSEIQDMISKGEIMSEHVVQAFKNMSDEGGRFANLMDKQAETYQGRVSNLRDSMNTLKEQIGTEMLPALSDLVIKFTEQIEVMAEDEQGMQSLGYVMQGAGDIAVFLTDQLFKMNNALGIASDKMVSFLEKNKALANAISGSMGLGKIYAQGEKNYLTPEAQARAFSVDNSSYYGPRQLTNALNADDIKKSIAEFNNLNKSIRRDVADTTADVTSLIGGGASEQKEKVSEAMKELERQFERRVENEIDGTEKIRSSVFENIEAIETLKEGYIEFGKEAIKAIEDLESRMNSVSDSTDKSLATRIIEIDAKIQELKQAKREATDGLEKEDIAKEIVALEREKQLAIENTTQSAIASAKEWANFNETQKILANEQSALAELEAKKLILEEELQAKKDSLDAQLVALRDTLGEELAEYETHTQKLRSFFESYYADMEVEARSHVLQLVQEYDGIVTKLQQINALRESTGLTLDSGLNFNQTQTGLGGSGEFKIDINFGGVTINGDLDAERFAEMLGNEINKASNNFLLGVNK